MGNISHANETTKPSGRAGGNTASVANGDRALSNVEDIAKMATPVNDLAQLNPDHVDAALLHEQEATLRVY